MDMNPAAAVPSPDEATDKPTAARGGLVLELCPGQTSDNPSGVSISHLSPQESAARAARSGSVIRWRYHTTPEDFDNGLARSRLGHVTSHARIG